MACGRSARSTGIGSHGCEQGSGIAITNFNGAIVDDHRRSTAPPSIEEVVSGRGREMVVSPECDNLVFERGTFRGFCMHDLGAAPQDQLPKTFAAKTSEGTPLGTRF